MAALPNKLPIIGQYSRPSDSRAILGGEASNEIIFAVVGGAGSGTSFIAKTLRNILVEANIDAPILKASKVILEWAVRMGKPIPPPEPTTLFPCALSRRVRSRSRNAFLNCRAVSPPANSAPRVWSRCDHALHSLQQASAKLQYFRLHKLPLRLGK